MKNRIPTEQRFISILLENRDLVDEWVNSPLRHHHFDKNHKLILLAIEKAFQKKALLTREFFYHFSKSVVNNQAELGAQMLLYDRISILSEDRNNYSPLFSQISDDYISEFALKYIEEFSKDLKEKGVKEAVKRLSKQTNDLSFDLDEGKKNIIYESVGIYAPQYLNILKEKRDTEKDITITCGIREIDSSMVVGFAPGTLTLFWGDVGSHKSNMMLNVGFNIWEKNHNVLLVPLEMPREKMYQRFFSLYTKIPFERLEHPKLLTKIELELTEKSTKELQQPSENHFYIMDSMERVPVSMIRKEIESHIDIFKPSVVIIDYIANLIPEINSSVNKSRNDLQIGEMLKDLRVMGRPGSICDEGFAIVSGAQIGREKLKMVRRAGSNKTSFNSEDVRGSQEYSADADNIYAQMLEEGQESSRLGFYAVKNRYGKKIFDNGTTRSTLELQPEICKIKSIEDKWLANNSDSIMKKINNEDIDEELVFDEETTMKQPPTNDMDSILGGQDDLDDNITVDDIDFEEIEI